MITNSKQNWAIGQTVKLGFMRAVVRAIIETPGDSGPDMYLVSNEAGTKIYSFTPHNGIEQLTIPEAARLIESQKRLETAREVAAQAHAANVAQVNAVFG